MKNKDTDARKQLVESLKDAENVLVTVNANPSVDELTAALGLALMLDKLDKHATAVFSGKIPRAIDFLDPEKTFEDTTDSLQDFIIALDKEKADHLRYKVDGDLVKIFITPYRTVINEKDLEFSQGDYNVDAVVAIGAESVDDLDKALADHGRIMHDAKVASISVGSLDSQLGTINLTEPDASSYSEVVASLAEDLRDTKSLLDEQTATALMTGIVAATERFSNERTTSSAMTLSAQLMAAGANQQLIATHLEDATDESDDTSDDQPRPSSPSSERETTDTSGPVKDRQAADGSMSISHSKETIGATVDEAAKNVSNQREQAAADEAEAELDEIKDEQPENTDAASAQTATELAPQANDQQKAEDELAEHLEAIQPLSALPPLPEINESIVEPSRTQTEAGEPSFGGVLNATTEEAAEEKRASEEADRNHTILTHNNGTYVDEADAPQSAVNSFNQPDADAEPEVNDIFGGGAPTSQAAAVQPLEPPTQNFGDIAQSAAPLAQVAEPYVEPTPAPATNFVTPDATFGSMPAPAPDTTARDEVNAAFDARTQPVMPVSDPSAPFTTENLAPAPTTGFVAPDGLPPLPPLPPMPDFSTLPPLPGTETAMPPQQPTSDFGVQPVFTAPAPVAPDNTTLAPDQMVDSLLPPLPDQGQAAPADFTTAPSTQPADPAQFQIPGQS